MSDQYRAISALRCSLLSRISCRNSLRGSTLPSFPVGVPVAGAALVVLLPFGLDALEAVEPNEDVVRSLHQRIEQSVEVPLVLGERLTLELVSHAASSAAQARRRGRR